jgi:hypothetical protein
MKLIKALMLSSFILISACSLSDIADFIKPSTPSVDAELVVGDKQESITTEVGTTKQEAETISNTSSTNIEPWFVVLAMLGWFLPTPQGLFKMWRNRNA